MRVSTRADKGLAIEELLDLRLGALRLQLLQHLLMLVLPLFTHDQRVRPPTLVLALDGDDSKDVV